MRSSNVELALPPFRGAVRSLILFSTAVYVIILLLSAFAPPLMNAVVALGSLSRDGILHGFVWQFLTYGFVNVDPLNFVLSMLGVYFLGSYVEMSIGARRFVWLYLSSLAIAGVIGFALSLTGVIGAGPAMGPGAAANAILMVFFLLGPGQSIMLFPIPINIPVRWVVVGTAAIEGAYLLLYRFILYFIVVLCGLAAGWIWFKLQPRTQPAARSGFGRGLSDREYAVRGAPARAGLFARIKNSYYRWKRKRAARKFEVYMRNHDRTVQFDEYGNYIPPADEQPKKGNGGSDHSGWVN